MKEEKETIEEIYSLSDSRFRKPSQGDRVGYDFRSVDRALCLLKPLISNAGGNHLESLYKTLKSEFVEFYLIDKLLEKKERETASKSTEVSAKTLDK